eukprot:TRINITY_DN617_c1_g1_i1.p1 TRINITY_DN617_c1_g1~~TRINITY_DN617_c1_g1_i1.p1  ORF type:complete len:533 (+),score=182.46 TRINITY_DN617_c1_g1_i1:26-1600(+)
MSKRSRESLSRTDTIALGSQDGDDAEVIISSDEEARSPSRKRPRTNEVQASPMTYATTTVMRQLDEDGSEAQSVPMVSNMRAASMATRQVLQSGHNNRIKTTPEQKIAREILTLLKHEFLPVEDFSYGKKEASHLWQSKTASRKFRSKLQAMLEASKEALKADPMVLELPSPCYVLGDLHGNYKDLQFFSRSFWQMGVDLSPARFVFLGDYVDRGPHSVETTAYLLALKVLHPDRVFLLRGNHEFAESNGDTNYNPCFKDSCQQVFGPKIGIKMWEALNGVFEWMPIAATIDKKIFCCHGGVPRCVKNFSSSSSSSSGVSSPSKKAPPKSPGKKTPEVSLLDTIKGLKRPMTDDSVQGHLEDDQDYLALDLLWADPATPQEEKITKGGWFGPNERGDDVIVFGFNAAKRFFELTGCTHMIRAHQPPTHGIEYCKRASIMTVFSSSHYCGRFNSAAIVLVSEGRIRVATTVTSRSAALTRTSSSIREGDDGEDDDEDEDEDEDADQDDEEVDLDAEEDFDEEVYV